MSATILAAYANFCEKQKHPAERSEAAIATRWLASTLKLNFPQSLAEYQQLNRDMYACWQQAVGTSDCADRDEFTTSGSSGSVRRYHVGPAAQEWVGTLWNLAAYPFGWRPIVRILLDPDDHFPTQVYEHREGLYQCQIRVGRLHAGRAAEIVKHLQELLTRWPALTVYSLPDIFLYLNRDETFMRFALRHRKDVNFFSGRWDAFYPKQHLIRMGVHFGDYMMDWPSGANFYTCSHGEQHVLPIFAEANQGPVNCLNLLKRINISDTDAGAFQVHDVVTCACGYNRPLFTYRPHQETAINPAMYDLELAEQLESHYRSLQLIQTATDKITIHADIEGSQLDRALLEQFVRRHGFQKIEWDPRPCFQSAGKRPPFFRKFP